MMSNTQLKWQKDIIGEEYKDILIPQSQQTKIFPRSKRRKKYSNDKRIYSKD
ncbi:hypothetical protein [Bacillus suaedaesalsae]|uniref:Uncharacterized protein n=1 Tax=Bacillus suaedaesalsae TaxID=2810349 RepID=A0ABS2DML6_9BACI|nr:hypothetical protein [Bacillus suaedaesalsae]MBM6618746.1 hypothetical protein [Bacillus suaedaesalsae]